MDCFNRRIKSNPYVQRAFIFLPTEQLLELHPAVSSRVCRTTPLAIKPVVSHTTNSLGNRSTPRELCSTWDSIASGKALGMKREKEKLRDCKSARKIDESDGLRAVCKGVQCDRLLFSVSKS